MAISRDRYPEDGSAAAVVLARRDDFADGLAGTPFAAAAGGPLLLTGTTATQPATRAELERVLAPGGQVFLLGGTAAIGSEVADDLEAAGFPVERLSGAGRFETAAVVARRVAAAGEVRTILIARASQFPDALAAGPAAIASRGVILLSDERRPHAATDAFLAAHPDARVVAVGGIAADAYPTAEAVFGRGRVETAVAVAERFFEAPSIVGFSRNDAFADALTGGVHIGRYGGPVLLTDAATLSEPVAAYLRAQPDVRTGFVYGGPGAIAEEPFVAIDRMSRRR